MKARRMVVAAIFTLIGLLFTVTYVAGMTGGVELDQELYYQVFGLLWGIFFLLYGIGLFIYHIPSYGWGAAALFWIAFSIGEAVGGFYKRTIFGAVIAVILVALQVSAIMKKKRA